MVGDTKNNGVRDATEPMVFQPVAQQPTYLESLEVRADDGDRMPHRCVVHRLGRDVAAVQEVLGGRQLFAGQRGMDALDNADILFRTAERAQVPTKVGLGRMSDRDRPTAIST